MSKKKFNNAEWDTYDSTYIQIISLKNGNTLSGYSKRTGYAEKNDKQALLINWIIRMHKVGYLDAKHPDSRRRIIEIEYYINKHPSKVPILRLFYNYYESLDTRWAMENVEVFKFLDTFYEALNEGKNHEIKSLYVHQKTRFNDPFDLSTQRFITTKNLRDYCHRMINDKKFTKEQAVGFYHKYAEKYFKE